jgi:hypothetical protein
MRKVMVPGFEGETERSLDAETLGRLCDAPMTSPRASGRSSSPAVTQSTWNGHNDRTTEIAAIDGVVRVVDRGLMRPTR